ncbi:MULTISPECIES: hypothetical protein [Sinorhizobium]|uniref:hypothetical protein n=1 Tax=Sinorhizobium TaxID=28105 RepID=UPI0001E4A6DB|nr:MULTISPECIES: hypothetical protein [Sinorhizobium]AEG51908.1 hypothetical protein Sinme_0136 [Sinorhizobium meliloti AK83]MDE4592375.1 hypothetical protein [Sinorhizobium meliloti]RVJ73066.1 hypothetical protein CN168_25985 [Sinorhizobium medicae]SEJ26090.1 hypothetical protein SAMN04244575_03682 [Sinorhizobium meliloti]
MTNINLRDHSRTSGRVEKKQRWLTAFIAHRLEMLLSPAWQNAPRPLAKLIERLEIEHLRHGGQNNGELYVSYAQFAAYGISKRAICRTLKLGEDLGLIEVVRGEGIIRGDIRPENAYRLTFVPAKNRKSPTDEWKQISKERAKDLVTAYRADERQATNTTRRAAA